MVSLAFLLRELYKAGSEPSRSSALPSELGSDASQNSPFTPSITVSFNPPALLAITGIRLARASIATIPKGSARLKALRAHRYF